MIMRTPLIGNRIEDTLYEAIFPELIKFTSINAIDELKSFISASAKNLMKLIVPIMAVIIVFAGPIVKLVFGEQYMPAVNALRILALGVLIARYTYWINPALLAMGKPGVRTVFWVGTTVVYLTLMLVLVPLYSYIGAALAFLGFALVKSVLSYMVLDKLLKKEQKS